MNPKPFELTVADRATTGVTVRPGRLVLRPSAPAIGLSAAMAVIGSGLLVCAALGAGVPFLLVPLGLLNTVPGWRSATARVTADQTGLKVRNHWRTRRLPWTAVQSISVHEVERPWGYFPYSGPWNGPRDFLIGIIRATDGRELACDALASTAYAGEDPANEAPRIKVAILNRWAIEQGILEEGTRKR